jgi:hypothetical protein
MGHVSGLTSEPRPPSAGDEFKELISWLYTRGKESVCVIQLSTVELAICGPGHKKSIIHFTTEDELIQFHHTKRAELIASGYEFAGYRKDRRSGGDRRQQPRPGDRRG